jgi:oligopeptide/dipeptide ABC transporter ATP-binding protein
METLLRASDVAIEIDGRELVSNVDIELGRGRTLGIVGESGSGKSLTCRALAGLLATVGGRISRGALTVAGRDLTAPTAGDRSGMYGRVLSLIPQNSLSALNPLMRIGSHLTETIKALDAADGMRPEATAADLLDRLGLREPERVLRMYPHQLSGGMRQRVMIALAIVGRPQLLIADEPTTALDVSVQKEILDVLRRLAEEDEMALVLVSHDLGVVSAVTESVAVMYAGMIVEQGPTDTALRHPRHPYAQALFEARPRIGHTGRLVGIPGAPATPDSWPSGCRFAPRCPHTQNQCDAALPALQTIGPRHTAACRRVHELAAPDRSEVGA